MTDSPQHNPASPEAVQLGYEPETLRARGLLLFLVLFLASMVLLQALLWWVMKEIQKHGVEPDAARSAVTLNQQPPAPNLQPSVGHDTLDYQDLQALKGEEDAMFAKLGWQVNPATHEIGIPTDIIKAVADQERARASAPFVPPTTTGKDTNSTVPGPVPPYDKQPQISGGQRP
jgi:hypothetical protein